MSLAVTGAHLDGERVGVRCEEGTIAAIGAEVSPAPGDETIDAGGAHLVPPLVNGHTHAAMTLFRGSGGDLPLMPWLEEKIWPVEAKLSEEDVYWGARLACAEMLRGGTTRFWDMYWQPGATARAVADAGVRAAIGAPLFDLDGTRSASLRPRRRTNSPASDRTSPQLLLRTRSTPSAKSRCAGSASSVPNTTCRSRSTSPRPRGRSRTASPRTAPVPPSTSIASGC